MAGKLTAVTISPLLLLFLLSLSSCEALQFQTLIPKSLPLPQSLSWDQDADIFAGDETLEQDTLSLQLHHLDHLNLGDANATGDALFKSRLSRDAARVEALHAISAVKTNSTTTRRRGKPAASFCSSIISGLAHGSGEYFTRLGVGTPARYSYIVLDTGSDVVWIQCSPCRNCYTQSDPVFDPTKSSTFAGVTCASTLCKRLDSPGCNNGKKCLYQVSYGDGSFTVGEFSTETMTFRRNRLKILLWVVVSTLAVRNKFRVGSKNLKRARGFSPFDTCFDLSGVSEVKVPTVVFHFKGANVALPASHYLIPVDNKGTFCFAFAGTSTGLSIIGNIQQQGIRVVYDLAMSRVEFAKDSCV